MDNEKKNGILLESGTNEIEIMEFTINDNLFGINVAKVREIMLSEEVKPMPHVHPEVEGIFKPRDIDITEVDLPKYLINQECPKGPKDLFIITNFNKMYVAFRVHSVVGISRISWQDIHKPDNTISGGTDGVTTGIAQCDGKLVSILDFEKILAEIAPQTSIQIDEVDALGPRERSSSPIWVAEDSILLSKMIQSALVRAGYENLSMFPNGRELWDSLVQLKDCDDLSSRVALIITDLEMPEMDGHHLTKRIKSNPKFQSIPVVIFSSLITEEMRCKGKEVGADEQLSKPEIGHLIGVLDELLKKSRENQKGDSNT